MKATPKIRKIKVAPLRRYAAMRTFIASLALLLVTNYVRFLHAEPKPGDEGILRSYMSGEYELIGRKADSTAMYEGHVTLRNERGVLQVIRTVDGSTDKSPAQFDTVAGADRIPVLRMHFHFDGNEYDAVYRWQSDPDNYPRFTGYLYRSETKSPGLEALFPIHK